MSTLIGAAAAAAGLMRVSAVFLVAAFSNLFADVIWYSIGASGKLEWFRRRTKVTDAQMDELQQGVSDNAVKMLLAAKLSVGFAVPTLIAVGLARVPWRRWLPAVFVGELIFTGFLVLVGYYAAELISQVERGIYYLGIVISLVFIVTIAIVIWRFFKRKPIQTTSHETVE
ncbi:MAG: hypothetical protein M9928_14760 [Anaerolineae bacterium]|nr:hypothetical protein [Anaerolineae bacterium]MCO5189486.1 hypothetical protein [Anaerolineae bacterium]MCO5191731.1 hypothetical protein [Anaerolineae bacterium]MCO5206294.1 hypothetical protein [Anaerolineae bacterium]